MIRINVSVPSGLTLAQEKISVEITSAMQDAAILVEADAKKNAGYVTGTLARSISSAVAPLGSGAKGIVSAAASYAKFVEEGTGLHGPKKQKFVIEPKDKQSLFWKGAKHPVRRVNHPGQRPKYYMLRALQGNKGRIEARFKTAVETALRGMGK